jgi:hypothetical protein
MRLRSPISLDWDDDPLPDDFVLIADKDNSHEVFEVRDVSNHVAIHLLEAGWIRVDE